MSFSPTSAEAPMVERAVWALPSGVPSLHVAHAALHVAAVVDSRGSRTVDARESYWHHATGGSFPPHDLRRGEQLLIDCGLLVELDARLIPAPELVQLLAGSVEDALAALCQRAFDVTHPPSMPANSESTSAIHEFEAAGDIANLVPDAARREELLLELGQRFDDTLQRLIGDIGENLVVDAARAELAELGHADLARRVRRVSLTSDQLGYDVTAPRIGAAARLLEVKSTTSRNADASVAVHLSRGEVRTGERLRDWAIVVCEVDDVERRLGRIIGWCQHDAIADTLPRDTPRGIWENARVEIDVGRLVPGLPSPFA